MVEESTQQMLDQYRKLIDALLTEETTRVKLVDAALESLECGLILVPIMSLNALQEVQKDRIKTLEKIKEAWKMEVMTPEEFEKEMSKIRDHAHEVDCFDEYAHLPMDNLMCNLLRSLGYGAGIDIFEDQSKWYE